jgi:hypothetical protein
MALLDNSWQKFAESKDQLWCVIGAPYCSVSDFCEFKGPKTPDLGRSASKPYPHAARLNYSPIARKIFFVIFEIFYGEKPSPKNDPI